MLSWPYFHLCVFAAAGDTELGLVPCGGGPVCVVRTAVCDGEPDCPDGSDEDGCSVTCAPGEHQCSDGSACVPAQFRCDAERDCDDGSDEEVCDQSEGGDRHGLDWQDLARYTFFGNFVLVC